MSKIPAGSASRESSIALCVGFKCNIYTYIDVLVTCKMKSSKAVASLADSMHRCQYNETPPLFLFNFIFFLEFASRSIEQGCSFKLELPRSVPWMFLSLSLAENEINCKSSHTNALVVLETMYFADRPWHGP